MAKSPSPSTHILLGDPPLQVRVRRSKRATRYALRVSRSDGRVTLSVPDWAPEMEALAFLQAREGWVRQHLRDLPRANRAKIGARLPVGGIPREIQAGTGRAARFSDGVLTVADTPRQGPRIKALLTALARERLDTAVARYAAQLGRPTGRLTLRDPRTRWGSCSSRGDLMFSWRLIMAPPEVLHYVAAHEVAHLAEMNHSPRFWAVCAALYPEYDAPKAWLRTHGADLLAWRFESQEGA